MTPHRAKNGADGDPPERAAGRRPIEAGSHMAKRAQVNTNLLRRSEVIEYERLAKIATSNAPLAPDAVRRLWIARLIYVLAWVIGIVIAAIVGGAMFGMTFAIGAAMYTAFTLGCLLGVAFTIQSAFATDRAKKNAQRAVDDYLEGIGYASRRERSGNRDRDDFQYKSRRQMQHEWYGDHSELNWRHREQAEMFGMDADTYVSNFLENDKD